MNKRLITLAILLVPFLNMAQQLRLSNHTMVVQGTSNLHNWESQVLEMKSSGTAVLKDGLLIDLRNVEVVVPVKKIESGKGLMNRKTYEAFNEPANPFIKFHASSAEINGKTVTLRGTLSMNGKSLPASIVCKYALSGNKLTLTGQYLIDMTTFKMEPPTALMGSIEVGPTVTIVFTANYQIH